MDAGNRISQHANESVTATQATYTDTFSVLIDALSMILVHELEETEAIVTVMELKKNTIEAQLGWSYAGIAFAFAFEIYPGQSDRERQAELLHGTDTYCDNLMCALKKYACRIDDTFADEINSDV